MSDKILLFTKNTELVYQIKSYLDDSEYTIKATDDLEILNEYLNSEETWLLIYDFLVELDENRMVLGNLLATYPFQLVVLVIDREKGKDLLAMIENYKVYDIVSYPIYPYRFHFTVTRAVTYGKVMSKISDFKSNEKKVFESMIKVFDWRKELDTRKVESLANELIHQINISFFHGSGLGSLISTLSILFTKSKLDEEKKVYHVHEKVYNLLKENYDEILKLSDSLSRTQSILAEKDCYSEVITLRDFYLHLSSLAKKMKPTADIKTQSIIMGDFPKELASKSIICKVDKLVLAIEELLTNAIKYSENNDTIYILFSHESSNFGIRILNPAYENPDGTVGITESNSHKIFEPFFRLTNVVDDRFIEETFRFGLGLTVVNKIMDMHKANISFYTTENSLRRDSNRKDVCVWLRFPIL